MMKYFSFMTREPSSSMDVMTNARTPLGTPILKGRMSVPYREPLFTLMVRVTVS